MYDKSFIFYLSNEKEKPLIINLNKPRKLTYRSRQGN